MSEKIFPIDKEKLEEIIKDYPTPFHIYDEKAIRANMRRLFKAFSWAPSFREHYAVSGPESATAADSTRGGCRSRLQFPAWLALADASGIKGRRLC